MFTGLTRQEQRTLLVLVGIVAGGVGLHQLRGGHSAQRLVLDARSGQELAVPEEALGAAGASPERIVRDLPPAGPVDLNTASATELMTLPGIGEARAADIISHRELHGPFHTVEQLDDVSGFGPATLERLRPHVTVLGGASIEADAQAASTPAAAPPVASQPVAMAASPAVPQPAVSGPHLVNVNTASATELESLPGIGEVMAQRIIEYRTAHGAFRRPEDLLEIPRIGERTLARLRPLITF